MIKEGEMLGDLIDLLKERAEAQLKIVETDEQILERHALSWYEGKIDREDDRCAAFIQKAKAFIQTVVTTRHSSPEELAEQWMTGICAIDEGYQPDHELDKKNLEKLDWKEITRHQMNGGTQYGIANNIRNQINDIAKHDNVLSERYSKDLLETASQRFNDHSND